MLSVLVALGFGVIYVGEYYALKSDSIAYEEAEQAIYEQKAAGIKDVKYRAADRANLIGR